MHWFDAATRQAGDRPMTDWPYPLWIAHRGAGKLAPENTLAAFRLGASHGYRAFECDVKLSADGVPFLLHDDTLERTTQRPRPRRRRNLGRAVARWTPAAGTAPRFAGEPLPSFEAIARYCLRNGFALNLEIKPTPGVEQPPAARSARRARGCGRRGHAAAVQFVPPEALAGARDTAPEMPRALLLDALWPGCLEMAKTLGCVAVITNHHLMDAELIARIRGAGLHALCYTVNDATRRSACSRSASTASSPTKLISIQANAATPRRLAGASASSSQPAPQIA